MKYTYIAAGLLLALSVSCGQKHDPAPAQNDNAAAAKTPLPGTPEEVVMVADDLALTMADYDRCIEVHHLMGRHFSKRALANPQFQRDEVQRCFQSKFLKDFMAKNKIAMAPATIEAATAKLLKENDVADVKALAVKQGIDPDHIQDVIADSAVPLAVQRYIITTMPDDVMRMAYDIDERVINVEVVDFDNSPSDEEVDAYLKDNGGSLAEYLKLHPDLLNSLPHVSFVRMGYLVNGDETESDVMRRWEALRLVAVQQGMDKALEKCESEKNSGCVVLNGKDNPLVEERSESNKWAFRMPEGSVSELDQSPVYRAFRITLRLDGPQPLDLHDAAVQKQIGRRALLDTVPSLHLMALLKSAFAMQDVNLQEVAKSLDGHYVTTEASFNKLKSQNLIESKKVLGVLNNIKPEEIGLISDPLLENDRLYVFRVKSVRPPTDADYLAHRDEWLNWRSDDASLEALNSWLQAHMPNMASQNLVPVQAKYGVLQPNGTIR